MSDKVCWSSREPWRMRSGAELPTGGHSDRLSRNHIRRALIRSMQSLNLWPGEFLAPRLKRLTD